jgi:hypothetical protein
VTRLRLDQQQAIALKSDLDTNVAYMYVANRRKSHPHRDRRRSVSWFKLDFLWTGCLPGQRRDGADPISAYRRTVQMVRAAVGEKATLAGCGAPTLASVHAGLDAVRTSPDIARTWEPADGDLTQPAGRSCVHTGRERAFLHPHPHLLRADPDVSLLAAGTENRNQILRHVASQAASLRVCGDRLPDLVQDPGRSNRSGTSWQER